MAFQEMRMELAQEVDEFEKKYFKNDFGDFCLLDTFFKITIHMSALYIRMGYARRRGRGPWGHGL